MLLAKRSRKVVAATFLTILVTNTFAPGISYALTSGPTQPEATSFEPIDTTDMVNQQTGDFTYNMPLLEVPGPEGGFPLSLAYHAGVMTNQDASWVGLGWSLNPGEINRNVNGYPDDWYHQNTSTRTYWSGGSTTTYQVGISIGVANTPATVSFGLAFANDTYRGFGVGFDEGIGYGFKIGDLGLNVGISMGISPYGEGYAGVNAGIGVNSHGFSASLGVSAMTNFQTTSAGFSGGIGYSMDHNKSGRSFGGSLLGVSLSTSGGGASVSAGGFGASVHNDNANKVSTKSKGFHVDIPVYYGINLSLGYSKVRYWTDETQNVTTLGSLYASGYATSGQAGPDNIAYDAFSLLEDPSYKNSMDYPDPTIVQGGAYPDFDVYSVNAQGLAGSMRPYLFQGGILNQNIKDGNTPKVTYYNPGVTNSYPRFRFMNDFSNSYRQTNNPYTDPSGNLLTTPPPFDPAPAYGNTGDTYGGGYTVDNTGNTSFQLTGSKYVDVNLRIHPRTHPGYVKTDKLVDGGMIEGYSITNESGMTYHFGLPAYSFNEENYQEKVQHNSDGTVNAFNRVTRSTPYAYTWYLTTMTGPDFVDRNGNGIADDGDWGYWVDFEYGKWNDQFNWRNPSEGFQRDEDNQFQNVSMGSKEVYYLNAIRTRSHVALFEKSVRYDGKGESAYQFFKLVKDGHQTEYEYSQGRFDETSAAALRLSKIYLLNASDENAVSINSDPNNITQGGLAGNVLDSYDVGAAGRANLEQKAIRVIDFNYDYSLCPGTSNSYDPSNPAAKFGKLTLTSVVTRGKGGANLLPATQFVYEQSAAEIHSQSSVAISGINPTDKTSTFTTSNSSFQVGDLIVTSGNTFCGVIIKKSPPSSGNYTYTLKNSIYAGGTVDIHTTKNPPYNKDNYDGWQCYKADLDATTESTNENASRMTTPASAQGADAWSLRTIISSLGAKVNISYEPDEIISSAYNATFPFPIKNIALQPGSLDHLTFVPMTYGYPLGSLISVGDNGGNIIIQTHYNYLGTGNPPGIGGQGEYSEYYQYKTTYQVTNVDESSGIVTAILTNPIPSLLVGTNNQGLYQYDKLYTGNISTENAQGIYGGGLRTSRVSMLSSDGTQSSTSYNYNNPASGVPSGVTPYLPSITETLDMNAFTTQFDSYLAGVVSNRYKTALNSDLNFLYSIARELPPPQVMYQYVTVTQQSQNPGETERDLPGSTMYQFEVFRNNMVGRTDITARTGPVLNGSTPMNSRNLSMQKFTGCLGNLRRIVQYDNTGKPIAETINHYLHDPYMNEPLAQFMTDYKNLLATKFNYQGYVEERYFEAKLVQNQPSNRPQDNGALSTMSAREEFPCVQTGQTVINYVNGTQTSTQNLTFDYYSGAVTQTLETDAYGNNFLKETLPAYRQYSAMGVKATTLTNKNMLTQTAETRVWSVDGTDQHNHLGLVSASVSTWSDAIASLSTDGSLVTENNPFSGDVWRPQYTYDWMPAGTTTSGLTATGSFTDFNWSNPSASAAGWVKSSEMTLYDVYSKALESKDINGSYAASHLNYNEQKVILTGGPANYYEIAFSGAEDAALSQTGAVFVKAADGSASASAAHTGAKSLLLGPGSKKGFSYSVPIVSTGSGGVIAGRNYEAAVWVKPASGTAQDVKLYYTVGGTVKGSSASSGASGAKTAGGWTLINLNINGADLTSGTLNVYCQNDHASASAYVDDMRFQPLNAVTTAYVYDPFSGELTHSLDNNNLYVRYEYDAVGRLARVYKEKLNTGSFAGGEFKSNQYLYNYNAAKHGNDGINGTPYQKNSCPLNQGYVGSMVPVTIPQNTYTSFISTGDANATATQYAQEYANANGTCICSPNISFDQTLALSSPQGTITMNGTRATMQVSFVWPSGNAAVELGSVIGTCAIPTANRTMMIAPGLGNTQYSVMIDAAGFITVSYYSGDAPVAGTTIGFMQVYDLQQNLFYSGPQSGTFYKACTPPQQGTPVPYSIPAFMFADPDQNVANSLATAYFNSYGQQNANDFGGCIVPCVFTPDASFGGNASGNLVNNGGSIQLYLSLGVNAQYEGGTFGTITGGCVPSQARFISCTDQWGNPWGIEIDTNGVVTGFAGGPGAQEAGNLVLSGTYNL